MSNSNRFYFALVVRKETARGIWFDAYRVEMVNGTNRLVLVPSNTFRNHPMWKGPQRQNTAKEWVDNPGRFFAPATGSGLSVTEVDFEDATAKLYEIPAGRVDAEFLV